MKNTILLLLFAITSLNLQAQINVVQVQEKEKPKEVIQPYDSLMSLNNQNALQHVGQTLFLRGTSYVKEEGGFNRTFYTKPSLSSYEVREYVYKPTKSKALGRNDIITDYDSVIGKYYLVTHVEKSKDSYIYENFCMELKDLKTE